MLIYALCFIYFTYDEELVILYWGFSEGSEGFTPPNPQVTPRKAPGKPQVTPSIPRTDEYWFQHHKKVFLVLFHHCIYRFCNL